MINSTIYTLLENINVRKIIIPEKLIERVAFFVVFVVVLVAVQNIVIQLM